MNEDSEVINCSVREDRILITEDKDFGQLVYAVGHASRGVILLRYPAIARQRLSSDVLKLVNEKKQVLHGCFVVLTPGRFRVVRLPK